MPPALRGVGITFIITGLMAIGFMSFGGMLTGGDDAEKTAPKEEATIQNKKVEKEDAIEIIADNTNTNKQ